MRDGLFLDGVTCIGVCAAIRVLIAAAVGVVMFNVLF
jgi:hypothetical protein